MTHGDHTPLLHAHWRSPLGELLLLGHERALTGLHLPGRHALPAGSKSAAAPFAAAIEQLCEYFAGMRRAFDLALEPRGSAFDQAAWDHLRTLPYGLTVTYAELAGALGRPDRVRAVGGAMARNPLAIVVPCHRVVGSDGSLTGYGGGLDRKRALLALEQGAWQETLL